MDVTVISELEHSRRDALVAYYLGQIASSKKADVRTANDLYEYLLIDNQVTSLVDGSVISTAIASVQQYINAIYNGMEPGYVDSFDGNQVQNWRNTASEYAVWAGYQMLADYPENYIDPTLRIGRTAAFDEFLNELQQSRLSETSVNKALLRYLSKFEQINNLDIVAGYIDGDEYGVDYCNADYYFLGRDNTAAGRYFWRKVRVAIDDESTGIDASAWTEWLPVDITPGSGLIYIRPVVMLGRLYVTWIEESIKELSDAEGVTTTLYSYEAKLAYRQADETWTVPLSYPMQQDRTYKRTGGETVLAFVVYREGKPFLVIHNHIYKQGPNFDDAAWLLDEWLNPTYCPNYEGLPEAYDLIDKFQRHLLALQHTISASNAYRKIPVVVDAQPAPTLETRSLTLMAAPYNGTESWVSITSTLAISQRRLAVFRGEAVAMTVETAQVPSFPLAGQATVTVLADNVISVEVTAFGVEHEVDFRVFFNDILTHVKLSPGQNSSVRKIKLDTSFLTGLTPADIKNGAGFKFNYALANTQWLLPAGHAPLSHASNEVRDTYQYEKRRVAVEANGGVRLWAGTVTFNGAMQLPKIKATAVVKVSVIANPALAISETPTEDSSVIGPDHIIFTQTIPAPLLTGPVLIPKDTESGNNGIFLDFLDAKPKKLQYVQLNTVFASQLINAARVSTERVLSWDIQYSNEAPLPKALASTPLPILDFNGANGQYFWELFFHAAHAVAHRLHNEFDFAGAEKWLHYLFNPQVRERPSSPAIGQDYWATRPLTFADLELSDSEVLAPVDPDAIARVAPSHYRKTIFMLYVRNLLGWGDSLYRRLTRDALNEAKLHYMRALSLLGPAPDARTVGRWDNRELSAVAGAAASDAASVLFESTLQAVEDSVLSMQGQPWLSLLLNKYFQLPVNTHLLALWTDLDLRLYNLRHNLTLDGKPLQMALYETPINPSDLMRAQKSANSAAQRGVGGKVAIAPYRFNALLPRVQNAVQTLMGFGEQVLHYREMRDRTQQDELAQTHVLALADFGIAMQVEALVQAQISKQALLKNKALTQKRHDYYAKLAIEDVSRLEKDSASKQYISAYLHIASGSSALAGGILNTAMNVFGIMSGGNQFGAVFNAAAHASVAAATAENLIGYEQLRSDQYRRRREEWELQRDQASGELSSLQDQLTAQESGISLAQRQVDYARQTVAQAQEMYSFLKTRTANANLYGWLLSQLSTFYFQAYDAVVGLCLSVERSWQFEMGDEETVFIQPNGWLDNYFGLTAGEALKLQLLRMESAYLRRHERRLELTKTISLKQALTDDKWTELLQGLKTDGSGHFDLTAQHFDSDYPGHYLRQLVHVGVSLPLVLGAYQDVRAILTQESSVTLLKPSIDSLTNLYPEKDDPNTAYPDTLRNVRSGQSIALSTGAIDHGQFSINPNDERYYPFEGTGAISSWQLYLPLHKAPEQAAVIEQLQDIVVHVLYRAMDGGKAFGDQVNAWLDTVEKKQAGDLPAKALPLAVG